MVVPDEQHGIFINIKITDSTMKLFKLFTLMAAGTMITACNNEIENLSRSADNRVMSLQTAGKAYTRFNDVTNTWENTDKIGVYMYGAGAGSTDILNGAENVLFTTQGGKSPVYFTSETGIQIAGENAKFTAYYPQNGDITDGIYKVALGNQAEGYAAHDLMWAMNNNVSSEDAKSLSMTFKHQLAKLAIEITSNSGEIVQSVSIQGISISADFNIATGEFSNEAKGYITPCKTAGNKYSALVLPTNPATALSMIITTDAAEDNTYEYTFNSGTISELKAGYIYTIKIGLGKSVLGSVDQIEGGNSPYEPGGDVDGNAEAVTPEISGYMVVEAPADDVDALAGCLNGKSGAIALKFVAGKTYKADMITVPAGITDLLLIGKEGQAKVTMKGLSVPERTLNKLTFQDLEIEGTDAKTTICAAELKEDAELTVKGCYIHGVKAVYGRGKDLAQKHSTDFSRLSSIKVDNCMIYNVESVFDYGVVSEIIMCNSTLYNLSGIAFNSFKNDEDMTSQCRPIRISNCTLIDLNKNLLETKGGGGSGVLVEYVNNISDINSNSYIGYRIDINGNDPDNKPYACTYTGNYAVTDSSIKLNGHTFEANAFIFMSRNELFNSEDITVDGMKGEKNFSTSVDAGDPRWKK